MRETTAETAIARFCGAGAPWLVAAALVLVGGASPPPHAEDTAGSPNLTTPADADGLAFFEKYIRPLFHEHCLECHAASGKAQEADLELDSSAAIRTGGSRGPLYVAGNPDASLLLRAVRYDDVDLQMPPEGKLPDADIQHLEEWIRRGAPLPEYRAVKESPKRGIDLAAGRNFWSFRPLAVPNPPRIPGDAWPRGAVDRFILDKLAAANLRSQAEADRRVLIRRATFDLIGLPPSPDEIHAFVSDPASDAYERLIDRLLASPHYGERWGRHWLDLTRYTDDTPDWQSPSDRGWLYRDWVISAFNGDMGYDEFVRQQLAADLYEGTSPHDLVALGFLGLSPTYWKELRLAPEVIMQIVADEWDERIDAVSRTFLGLTVSCARCHDHKYDPVTMQDYYALAGVFASTQVTDRPLLPPDAAAPLIATKHKIDALNADLAKIADKKSEPATKLQAEIDSLKQTPGYDGLWAHAVEEASLYVMPDGPDMTRLDTRPGESRDLAVFKRGNPTNLGDVVPRRFLQVLAKTDAEPFTRGSGRRELAESILGDAQPLAARVIVNRVWRHHFGQGIVRTPSDFGVQGEPPTHPELLDWLAARFIAEGWSLKWLHRELMLSAAYRQSGAISSENAGIDPENRLLWRMNPRRLEIEAWRDAMLAASGQLDPSMGGPASNLAEPATARRSVYGKVSREELNTMLRLYDFPEPTAHSPNREATTTPLQQLFVLNSPLVLRQAQVLAERVATEQGDDSARLNSLYELLYGRLPEEAERALLLPTLTASGEAPIGARWTSLVHVLLGANEFLFVD